MNIITQYNTIGKKYINNQKKFFKTHTDRGTISILKLLPSIKHKKVLDVGCGHGRDILMYEKMNPKEIWGIDSSKVMVDEAKTLTKHPERILVSNIEKTPFKNKQFDIVVARFSLHYLNDFKKAYREIRRILKSGGVFIACVNHPTIDLVQRKKQGYREKEIVTVTLYDEVNIKFPSHTLDEYFSKEFFEYFYLCDFIEDGSEDVYVDPKKAPDFMTFKAIKKSHDVSVSEKE